MPQVPTPGTSFLDDYNALKKQVAELGRALGKTTGTLRDAAGNALVSSADTGLGRPFLPITFTPADTTKWAGTTAAPGVMATATIYRQHSHVIVPVFTVATAGTTGTIQLQVAGVTVGAPITLGSAVALTTLGPEPLPGAHMDLVTISVLAGRASGAGTFSIQVGSAYSLQP